MKTHTDITIWFECWSRFCPAGTEVVKQGNKYYLANPSDLNLGTYYAPYFVPSQVVE